MILMQREKNYRLKNQVEKIKQLDRPLYYIERFFNAEKILRHPKENKYNKMEMSKYYE